MKAVQVKNVGKDNKAKASDLYIDEVAIPDLKDGDVLVKVRAFGVNRMDIMQRQGLYPVSSSSSPGQVKSSRLVVPER